jgi:uncharacterized protein YjbJ (UPF0337 family)
MNWDQVQGKWKQITGSVRARWGQLTDDDLNVISGRREELIGRIQERYGIAKDEARNQVDQWSASVPDSLDGEYATHRTLERKAS